MKREFVTTEPINKGWSGDRKYRVTDDGGNVYMLRVSDANKRGLRRICHELMRECEKLGVPMCRPIDMWENENGEVCTLVEWIDGVDAEENIPKFPPLEQYRLGVDAGRALGLIHSVPAPDDAEDWEVRFNRKIDRKLKMYAECPLKYENGEAFIDFIAENRALLFDRTQTMQHGDFHIGNMMLDKDGRLVIIDFDRCDAGDPWEEFNRIVWSAQASPYFASGMVDGYFDCDVPEEFWSLLALYISSNTLSSLPWALPFGDAEIQTMRSQAAEVLGWYDNMTNVVPNWYTSQPNICFCGYDCLKCIVYRASNERDPDVKRKLTKEAVEYYKTDFGREVSESEVSCRGGRSDDTFVLCRECPWKKCARDRGLDGCFDCPSQCASYREYSGKYVN